MAGTGQGTERPKRRRADAPSAASAPAPRPWSRRRWMRLAREVGVIVLGVLIALAADQAAQALHWRNEVIQGRASLREELQNSAFAARERVAMVGCLDARLSFLQQRLEASGARWEAAPWSRLAGHPVSDGQAYFTPMREWESEVWRALSADGTATHFPRAEMLRLTTLYQYLELQRADNVNERARIAPVAMLGRSFPLSETARYQIGMSIEEQKGINRVAALGAEQILVLIDRAGMSPSGARWERQMAGLAQSVADCAAGRRTGMDAEGFPVAREAGR